MLKTLLLSLGLGLCTTACGTICNRVDAAEQGITEKGKPCNANGKGARDVTKCNNGLSSCSPDDLDRIAKYADCLEQQPTCDPATSFGWGLAVAGCSQPLFGVSAACLNAVN